MNDEEARKIIARFGEMRSELASVSGRLADLAAEEGEHSRVVAALEPMAKDRRCWRLVGDVLVERTVGEVLPAVQSNQAQLAEIVAKLRADVKAKEDALVEYQQKHGIRIRDGPPPQPAAPAAGAGGGAKGEGVLV